LVGLFSQLWSFQQVLREVTFKKFSIRLVKSS
jgi:hypothetical protein